MALAVTISGSTGPVVTYRLQAETLRYGIDRSPAQIPLPGNAPLIIDLGQYRPRVTIEGILGTSNGDDGGVTIPSFFNLATAVLNWYNTTITLAFTGYSETGKIQSLQGTLTAAQEEYWAYTLVFVEGET